MNYSYTDYPGYSDLIVGYGRVFKLMYNPQMMKNYSFPIDLFYDLKRLYKFPLVESLPIICWAVMFTIVRKIFEASCKVSGLKKYFQLMRRKSKF